LGAQANARYSILQPKAYTQSNIKGTRVVLKLIAEFHIPQLVFASSSSVYGENKKVPFQESDKLNHIISYYAETKKTNELDAERYQQQYGFKCTGLRFFTVYGPWGRPDMAYYLFTTAILQAQPIELFRQGKLWRDFTYIDDIVDGVVKALKKPQSFEIINLGNNRPVPIKRMVQILERLLGKKAIIKFKPRQPGDVLKTYAGIKKAQKLLNWRPQTKLETGLKQFVDWYKKYYKFS